MRAGQVLSADSAGLSWLTEGLAQMKKLRIARIIWILLNQSQKSAQSAANKVNGNTDCGGADGRCAYVVCWRDGRFCLACVGLMGN